MYSWVPIFSTGLNAQYTRNSNFVSVLEMEYVHEINIFGQKNDGEKWSRKSIFEIPLCAKPFSGNLF